MRRHWWRHEGPWGAPFGRWSRFFEGNEMRLALLSLLEQEPKHGYQLIKDLEDRSGGSYRASAGAVYPTLQQLEDEGMLTSEMKDGKRVYTLTESGKAELAKHADDVKRIWQRTESYGAWMPGYGLEGAMVATAGGMVLKAAISAVKRSGGNPDLATKVRDILDRTRHEIEAIADSGAR